MTTNREKVEEALDDLHDLHFGPIDAFGLSLALSSDDLIAPDAPNHFPGATEWDVRGNQEWSVQVWNNTVTLNANLEVHDPESFADSRTVDKTWHLSDDEAHDLAAALLEALKSTRA